MILTSHSLNLNFNLKHPSGCLDKSRGHIPYRCTLSTLPVLVEAVCSFAHVIVFISCPYWCMFLFLIQPFILEYILLNTAVILVPLIKLLCRSLFEFIFSVFCLCWHVLFVLSSFFRIKSGLTHISDGNACTSSRIFHCVQPYCFVP